MKKRSLEFTARRFAKANAIARSRNFNLPANAVDAAYAGYVAGDLKKLSTAVTIAAELLEIRTSEIHSTWKALPQDARRETARLAFVSN